MWIWMRHAARLPPPPIFDDRRLVQLIAFLKLRIIDHSLGVCMFVFAVDSCIFVQVAVCSWCLLSIRVRRRWQYWNLLKTNFRNWLKIVPTNPYKFVQNPFKIDQNDAQERSKSCIGSKSFSRTTKSERSGWFVSAFWQYLFFFFDDYFRMSCLRFNWKS